MEPRRFLNSRCGVCPLCKPAWLGQDHNGQMVAEGLESLEPVPGSCAACSQKVIVVLQSLSHVQFFATPWTAARQDSLSFTISRNLLKLRSVESVMPSSHLVLCRPLLFLLSIFSSIRVFSKMVGSTQQIFEWRSLLSVLPMLGMGCVPPCKPFSVKLGFADSPGIHRQWTHSFQWWDHLWCLPWTQNCQDCVLSLVY